MNEMVAELFAPHDMPEQPKESFFKGLFGGGTRNLDREELCTFFSKQIYKYDYYDNYLVFLF